jgi:integrase
MGVKVRKPRGHRSWCGVIDHDGQRRTKTVGSREAAERVKREIEARLALGGLAVLESEPPPVPKLSDYAKTWIKTVEAERKPSTAGFYRQYLRLHVEPRFGEERLGAISREQVKAFIGELRTRNLAKNTIRLAVTALRAILSAAVEDGLIAANPAQRLGRFVKSEKPKREATSLTSQEANQLLRAGEERLSPGDHALLFTALRAGLREGELAGLQWGDLHFGKDTDDPNRYIVVQRNYDRRWSRTMLTPKNTKSRRVDMTKDLRRVLLALRGPRGVATTELVFPSDAGTPIEMNNFSQRTFAPLLTAAGLRKIRFHDLQHTFGSLLIQAGASLAYVRDQMGHSSIQVTVDIYGHLVPGANIVFVDRLDQPEPSATAQQSATPAQQSLDKEIEEI